MNTGSPVQPVASRPLPVTWEPKVLLGGVIGACVLLEAAFAAFGMPDIDAAGGPMFLYGRLTESYILTLITAGVLFTAGFTAILAWEQVRQKMHVAAPILGVAICWGAAIDVCYVPLADGLSEQLADTEAQANAIAFVWAVCRTASGIVLIAGACILLRRGDEEPRDRDMTLINLIGPAVFVAGYLIARFGATMPMVTDAPIATDVEAGVLLKRPWDLAPLLTYAVAGLAVFPMLHRLLRSQFTLSIWAATLPAVLAHAHMTFGSGAVFDRSFFLAHLLVLVAYLARLFGLLLDHSRTYAQLRVMHGELAEQVGQRRATERTLETVYQEIIESLPIAAFRKDIDGRFTFVNEGFCKRVGRTADSILGKQDNDLFPYELAQKYRDDDQTVINSRRSIDLVEENYTADGDAHRVRVFKSPLIDESTGEVIGVHGVFWDVESTDDDDDADDTET